MKLQVVACDIDQKFPATTYTVTASDGRSASKDLCAEHAAPFEALLEPEGRPDLSAGAQEIAEPSPAPEQAVESPSPKSAQRAPAKKATPAKKAAPAKKATPARRRAKIVSLAEIEASKKP
ncbi:hypothetical protein [Streptomyces sp. NPDC051546]|uniref:hypothetical protein n=1 Tax=Streptomyces sp. NPDC051546 TaxID=3365655 RepID=UPI0037B817A9